MEQVMVFLKVEPNQDNRVLNSLKSMKIVKEAHLLYGPYDAYFEAEANTMDELEKLITNDLRNIRGIKSSMSCFIAGYSNYNP
jgi:DNA-binding Lrp family transcriptional regulator